MAHYTRIRVKKYYSHLVEENQQHLLNKIHSLSSIVTVRRRTNSLIFLLGFWLSFIVRTWCIIPWKNATIRIEFSFPLIPLHFFSEFLYCGINWDVSVVDLLFIVLKSKLQFSIWLNLYVVNSMLYTIFIIFLLQSLSDSFESSYSTYVILVSMKSIAELLIFHWTWDHYHGFFGLLYQYRKPLSPTNLQFKQIC